ncbi:MAG TPA: hypothetical protein VF593_03160 [Chthoniobacteraceae bacterium]|jgi:uncharacterized protein YdeI (BOF family)
MKTLTTISLLAAITFGLSTVTFAAEKKMKSDAAATPAAELKKSEAKPSATPEAKSTPAAKAKTVSFRGEVAAVDAKGKTFTIKNADGRERVFALTETAKITKDNASADVSAITTGAYATGSYRPGADGKLEVVTLKIGVKPVKATKVETGKAE